MRNDNKSPKIPYSELVTGVEKVLWNPYPEPEQLISSSDW